MCYSRYKATVVKSLTLGHRLISFVIAISLSKTINKAHNSCIWNSLELFKVEIMAIGAFNSFSWM